MFSGFATGNIGLLLDAVPDPMVVTDVEGAILRVSKSAARLLGYPALDLEGRPLEELLPEDLRDACAEHRIAFLANGEETGPELETSFVTASGGVIPIDASVGRVTLDGDTYLLLVMREVSDRVAIQQRLERMVALDELIMSVSSRLNTPSLDNIDREVEASVAEVAAFGQADDTYIYSRQDSGPFVLHSRAAKSEDHKGVVSIGLDRLPWISNIIAEGVPTKVRLNEAGSPDSARDRRLLRDAGVASLVVVPLRVASRSIGFLGIESNDHNSMIWPDEDLPGLAVLQDFLANALERKRIASDLQMANRVLHAVSQCNDALIRATDEGELLRDVCQIVVETGDYAMAWVGYALNDDTKSIVPQAQWGGIEGFAAGLHLTWADGAMGRGPAGVAVRTRKAVSIQDTSTDPILGPDSPPFQHGLLSAVAVPMFYGDEIAGVMGVYDRDPGTFNPPEVVILQRFANDLAYGIAALRARDRQRAAEEQLRDLLRSKDELIASIAHELRTPLTAVVGFAEMLRNDDGTLEAEAKEEMLRLVADQGMDLKNIVDDLLVAAKVEAGTLKVARVRVDVRAQAAQVLEAWDSDLSTKVEVRGAAQSALADPARVRQILRNLFTNAVRYGGDRISVTIGHDEENVFVRVEDDGTGVPEEEKEAIFEPYRRAHTAPGLTASMGLGLSISRQLARLMEGDLTYHRDSDLTVFTLSMPRHGD